MSEFRNFLGQTISVGDVVVYPATSGRSTQMVEAVVEKVVVKMDTTVLSVTVQPTGRTSRYSQHYPSDRYIDSRTGKGIDGYADKHIEREAGYLDPEGNFHTREETWEEAKRLGAIYTAAALGWTWTPSILKDYVQKVAPVVKPVVLSANAGSIVRPLEGQEEEL